MKTTHLRLEFSPRAREISALGAVILLVSVCALVAIAVQLGLKLADNARQAQRLAALEEQLGQSKAKGSRTRPPDPGEVARLRAARQVASQLTTPWADLLDSLESSPVKSVALLSIEPSVNRRSIRLTAEARSLEEMLAYLSALQQDGRLSAAVLVSHQVQVQSPGSPVRFQIQAGWGTAP